jgi:hypothetical protein
VKTGDAPLAPNQRSFDSTVQSGTPATARLNGDVITITSVRVVRMHQIKLLLA